MICQGIMLSNDIIESLRCPIGKAELKQDGDFLICSLCGVKFPVRDNIPVLMTDEAIMPEGIKDISGLKCSLK